MTRTILFWTLVVFCLGQSFALFKSQQAFWEMEHLHRQAVAGWMQCTEALKR